MSEIWNPYEEKTKRINSILKFFSEHRNFILILIVSFILSNTAITMFNSYLYRTQNNIPCKEVQFLIKELKK